MNLLIALTTLTPLVAIFLPGLFIIRWPSSITTFVPQLARAILWSISLTSLAALFLSAVGLPPAAALIISLFASLLLLVIHRYYFHRQSLITGLSLLLIFIFLFLAFSVPFLKIHHGLPTGDAQKSIYWAENILATHSLPDYSTSFSQLNRDPVDFFTPALHALTAATMQATLYQASYPYLAYTAVGFLAITLSLGVLVVALALAAIIVPPPLVRFSFVLISFVLLTHYRFLRYLREPGYHLQNVAGELLLFGSLFLLLSLIKNFRRSDLLLLILVVTTLFLTHQFSAFLAGFVLLPPATVFLGIRWSQFKNHPQFKSLLLLLIVLLSSALIFLGRLGLHHKIPHFLNLEPHLLSFTPSFTDYFSLLGWWWLIISLLGLIHAWKSFPSITTRTFLVSTLLLFILSQAPRFYLDIPPVRALLYSVVPLSIVGAIALSSWLAWLYRRHSRLTLTLATFLFLIATISGLQSLGRAYQLSPTVRTNSTLQPQQLPFINYLRAINNTSSVLYDDYNRRSASWLILSGHPTYSRISSDIKVQMKETKQSAIRQELYLKQLDYEKIFMLGGRPEVVQLLDKYNIRWLVGANKSSSTIFTTNPSLQPVLSGSDLSLFTPKLSSITSAESNFSRWLLRTSTLVNDLGNAEDTFLHLPASIRATRLSNAQTTNNVTYRTSTAPLIPLYFNANDYVSLLWDRDEDGYPDVPLQLSVKTYAGTGNLTVRYGNQQILSVPTDGTPVTLSPRAINFTQSKYVVITIENPSQQPLNIDLIALGLSRTP